MGKLKTAVFSLLGLVSVHAWCGSSMTGKDYTNFGNDLSFPVFAKNQAINVYKNKNDATPLATFKTMASITMDDNKPSCWSNAAADGWVKCELNGVGGWIKRSEFYGPGEYAPVEKWPFRYWMSIAGTNMGEEGVMLFRAVANTPNLIKPEQFDQAFFIASFDEQGFAFSPKTGKKTGERIFLSGNEVYLAPADPDKRSKKKWLFLAYYNEELQALCPAAHKESCYSAVNLAPNWGGSKALHTPAPKPYTFDAKREDQLKRIWNGPEEVAFARHADPVVPLMYRVPEDVSIKGETMNTSEAAKKKNREKMFCLIDCNGAANPVKFGAKPAP